MSERSVVEAPQGTWRLRAPASFSVRWAVTHLIRVINIALCSLPGAEPPQQRHEADASSSALHDCGSVAPDEWASGAWSTRLGVSGEPLLPAPAMPLVEVRSRLSWSSGSQTLRLKTTSCPKND